MRDAVNSPDEETDPLRSHVFDVVVVFSLDGEFVDDFSEVAECEWVNEFDIVRSLEYDCVADRDFVCETVDVKLCGLLAETDRLRAAEPPVSESDSVFDSVRLRVRLAIEFEPVVSCVTVPDLV